MLFYFVVVCGGDVEVIFVVAAVLSGVRLIAKARLTKNKNNFMFTY